MRSKFYVSLEVNYGCYCADIHEGTAEATLLERILCGILHSLVERNAVYRETFLYALGEVK